jgi:hypothetical protein
MPTFKVLDDDDEVINTVEADAEFMAANFSSYTEVDNSVPSVDPRVWRDAELKSSDWVVQITDHPQRDDYLKYREKLRDWPKLKSYPSARYRPKL